MACFREMTINFNGRFDVNADSGHLHVHTHNILPSEVLPFKKQIYIVQYRAVKLDLPKYQVVTSFSEVLVAFFGLV